MMIKKYVITLLFLLASPSLFAASSLLVWPIYQIIDADKSSAALWMENRGNSTVGLQIRIMAWQQVQYQDRYAEQRDVTATPPFIKLEPGKRTMIRLMRTSTAPAAPERAFRIIIDEIATPYLPQGNNAQSGVQFQMRYLLPLFLRSAAGDAATPQPELSWRIASVEGKPYLYVRNTGPVHARLSNVYWSAAAQGKGAHTTITEGFLGYVFPAQEMRWPLPASAAAPGANLNLFTHLADGATPVMIKRG